MTVAASKLYDRKLVYLDVKKNANDLEIGEEIGLLLRNAKKKKKHNRSDKIERRNQLLRKVHKRKMIAHNLIIVADRN